MVKYADDINNLEKFEELKRRIEQVRLCYAIKVFDEYANFAFLYSLCTIVLYTTGCLPILEGGFYLTSDICLTNIPFFLTVCQRDHCVSIIQ